MERVYRPLHQYIVVCALSRGSCNQRRASKLHHRRCTGPSSRSCLHDQSPIVGLFNAMSTADDPVSEWQAVIESERGKESPPDASRADDGRRQQLEL